MYTFILKKRLTQITYAVHLVISFVLPVALMIFVRFFMPDEPTFQRVSGAIFLSNSICFAIVAVLLLSILLRNRFFYLLNVFAVLFLVNMLSVSKFPDHFLAWILVVYTLMTLFLYWVEFKWTEVHKTLLGLGRD